MNARSLSFDAALADLARLLLRMALSQTVPEALEEFPERARIEELARKLDPESIQLHYQIALQGREDLPLAPDEHAGFLMTVLRMLAFRPEGLAKIDLTMRTAFGMIGVRGTKFFAGPSRGVFGVFVEHGLVEVTGGGVTRQVGRGQGVDIATPGAAPSEVAQWGDARIREAYASVGVR